MDRGARKRRSIGTGPITVADRPPLRPVDAASLIVFDGPSSDPRVLMGKRSARHAFMPSVYVFPGGRVDVSDGALSKRLLPEHDARRIHRSLGSRATDRRVRAIANAAIRETLEETGYNLGEHSPDAPLRYVARAVTPPGRTRRFDARFLACPAAHLTETDRKPTDELEDLRWVRLKFLDGLPFARITEVILREFRDRLRTDPDLEQDLPIPHHRMRNRSFVRLLD